MTSLGNMVNFIKFKSWLYEIRLKRAIKKFNSQSHDFLMAVNNQKVIFQKIKGHNNKIIIGEKCSLYDPHFTIIGNGNVIQLGNDVIGGNNVSFIIHGNNCSINIGNRVSISHSVEFCCQEDSMSIEIGEHCLFSHDIVIRTSDSHPIYSIIDGKRQNLPKPVRIGQDVWIAPNTKIMKGAIIGNGSIIGSDSMVTKEIPSNCLAVGHPARVVKENVMWSGEKLFEV